MSADKKAAHLKRYFAHVLRTYGITEAEWREVFKAQGGACAICHRPFRLQIGGAGNGKMPAVDHNHFTGEVRGLLCGGSLDPKTCNRLIGYHNAATLRRAADYLEHPPARAVLMSMRTGVDRETISLPALESAAQQIREAVESFGRVNWETDS